MPKYKSQKILTKTKPYKTILIEVHPDFVPRIAVPIMGGAVKGTTSNLSIAGYLTFLFEINEYLPKHHKLTDFQIAKLCANEFPKSKPMQRLLEAYSKGKTVSRIDSITYYRNKYNLGRLVVSNPGRKGPISFRYNSDGIRIAAQPYRKAPLTFEEEQAILDHFGPDHRRKQDFNYHVQENHPVRKPKGKLSYDSFDWVI